MFFTRSHAIRWPTTVLQKNAKSKKKKNKHKPLMHRTNLYMYISDNKCPTTNAFFVRKKKTFQLLTAFLGSPAIKYNIFVYSHKKKYIYSTFLKYFHFKIYFTIAKVFEKKKKRNYFCSFITRVYIIYWTFDNYIYELVYLIYFELFSVPGEHRTPYINSPPLSRPCRPVKSRIIII